VTNRETIPCGREFVSSCICCCLFAAFTARLLSTWSLQPNAERAHPPRHWRYKIQMVRWTLLLPILAGSLSGRRSHWSTALGKLGSRTPSPSFGRAMTPHWPSAASNLSLIPSSTSTMQFIPAPATDTRVRFPAKQCICILLSLR
jgi:hypothetical protein